MSEDSNSPNISRFACEGCEKQYRWKPQLAGRRVRCTNCGTIMIAPQNQPDAESDLYDLVPESRPVRKQPQYDYDIDVNMMSCAAIALPTPSSKHRSTTLFFATVAAIASLTLIGLAFRMM